MESGGGDFRVVGDILRVGGSGEWGVGRWGRGRCGV